MKTLKNLKCIPCREADPIITEVEIKELHQQAPDWKIVKHNNMKRLERDFKFKDFKDVVDFTNKVGKIAEEEGHRLVIVTQWGKVKVAWWTHKIKGLHLNDFIMAAKTDEPYLSE